MSKTHTKVAFLPIIRTQVRELLERSPSYQALPKTVQKRLAKDMAKVATYLVGGDLGETIPTKAVCIDETPGTSEIEVGRPFQPGPAAFADLTSAVDFPKFVAGLIGGVFEAIVDASIQQMEAFAELLKDITKSVDEFMEASLTDADARDTLVDQFPDTFETSHGDHPPFLKIRKGYRKAHLSHIHQDYNLKQPLTELDDGVIMQQIIPATLRRLALNRQQLVASQVLMGINRIVVTDGKINAKIIFE